MTIKVDPVLPHVQGATVVPIRDDEWGVAVTWSTGDHEVRHVGSREVAEREAKRLLAGMQPSPKGDEQR